MRYDVEMGCPSAVSSGAVKVRTWAASALMSAGESTYSPRVSRDRAVTRSRFSMEPTALL